MKNIIPERYYQRSAAETVLLNAMHEIDIFIADDDFLPVSMTLDLWIMGFEDPRILEKLISACELVLSKSSDPYQLTAEDFFTEFQTVSDQFSTLEDDKFLVKNILVWLGLHRIPILYPIGKEFEARIK
ncbi:hypothetical protein [Eupransor demetentiae]|uniref:Uncharacterized protein n=1 Tax=Eupransor demetentiae TaxID=3109584 RepID=A0ABM9N6A6_9LACO|nr:hypothetical protein R54876_GBNLAHCA_01332 [Lactobacillaceae bacterium LMG 33000]